MLEKIEIEISKTSNGQFDYVQIRSPGAIPVNIVLVAKLIVVKDVRGK